DLAADPLTLVVNALALVRVGTLQLPNDRCRLADLLLVDTFHGELRGALDREGHSLRSGDRHRVTETQRELQVVSLRLHPVTDAVDLHPFLVPVGDTDYEVVDQRPGETVQRTVLSLVVGTRHDERTILVVGDPDRLRDRVLQRALRPLDTDPLTVDGRLGPVGDTDRALSDT